MFLVRAGFSGCRVHLAGVETTATDDYAPAAATVSLSCTGCCCCERELNFFNPRRLTGEARDDDGS